VAEATVSSYAPHPDATAEAEISALANVYRFILDCHARKGAATSPVSPPDDTTMRNKKGVSYVDRRSD
jgi:hypothetical protein